MTTLQFTAAGIATGLTFYSFLPYIRSIRRKETRPHVFSWIVWGISTTVVFFAQLADGGGLGAWPIGISGAITFYVAFLAYQRKADTSIRSADWIFFSLALSALPAWSLTADPLWAVVLLTSVDILGFGPTLRKAYYHPHEEQRLFYFLFALRNVISLMALQHLSITTTLFPVATALACLLLIALLTLRRAQIASISNQQSKCDK